MMALWITIFLFVLGFSAWLVRPFLTRTSVELNEADSAVSIYRDQIDELHRDQAAGLISNQDFDAAHHEIETRAFAAAQRLGAGISISRRSPRNAALLSIGAGMAAALVYVILGAPSIPDQPLAARRMAALEQRAEAGDLTSRINILIEKTKANPQSFEDWWMLARSYAATGDHASAADAYRHAAELSNDRPAVLAAYGESLTLANGNKVPQAARLVFEQILQKAPDPRARYYVALAKAQAQDFQGAIEDWAALARDSEPEAPWMPLVRRDIANMARFVKADVTDYLSDATPAERAQAGSGVLVDPIDLQNQAAELAADLEAEPKDYRRWIALAETQAALGENDKAASALAAGRGEFVGAPFVQTKFDEAARALGLDVIEMAGRNRGPDANDITDAAALTEQERDEMIAGMVAGLAARLDEQPNDPDGWIMLIRSYSVLGNTEKAQRAYENATKRFSGDEAVLVRLSAGVGDLLEK